jgi:biopolymer transport protein ExbB/TolQ
MTSVSLSPTDLFLMAGPVGKTVILALLAASIWCWVIMIEGIVKLIRLRNALLRWHRGEDAVMLRPIIEAARSAGLWRMAGEGMSDARARIIEAMNRPARDLIARIEGGLANLAVIASVAPFIGLFGTVWGIMSSFTAIAASKDTSLAVVAPGIAEALATTAIGLAAAIPASIGYTRIGASIGRSTQELSNLIEDHAMKIVITSTPKQEVA